MKTTIVIIGIIIAIITLIWVAGSYYVIKNLEEPQFTLIEKKQSYEIRAYESYIVAEVEVSGNQNTALNQGFRYLAEYIFGGNSMNDSIAMTVPVTETKKQGTQISMTAPVINTLGTTGMSIVQFSMPSKYTMQTLPIPNNNKVSIKTLPGYTAAVLVYSGYATEKKVEIMKNKLLEILKKDNKQIVGDIVSAQYNPPLSFPLLRRNEIIIPIQ